MLTNSFSFISKNLLQLAKLKYLGREKHLEGAKSLKHTSKNVRTHIFGLISVLVNSF